MFHVITGGSGSGKSAYAEDCIVQLHKEHSEQAEDVAREAALREDASLPLYYVATMMPFGAEMETKIARHRQMRAGKGFETIECFQDLQLAAENFSQESDILLECMSNLVANEWFSYVQNFESSCFSKESIEMIIEKIWQGVLLVKNNCEHLVIVTNEVCSECVEDTIEMNYYKQILAGINYKMAAVADKVTEVVYGIPVKVK